MLQDRFAEFARDTHNIGSDRVARVNQMADTLIEDGHTDAATIAEWKDQLNESWADLLELIETRTQVGGLSMRQLLQHVTRAYYY